MKQNPISRLYQFIRRHVRIPNLCSRKGQAKDRGRWNFGPRLWKALWAKLSRRNKGGKTTPPS